MAESTSSSPGPEDAAAAQARRRKERREAKIKAGGSARLNKITGLGGGIQRDPPSTPPQPAASSQEHADPDEVDISEHFYQPSVTPRSTNTPSPRPDAAASDEQLRQLIAQQGGNPFLFGPSPTGDAAGTDGGINDADADPMAAMLNQMMQAMGGMGGARGPGGPEGDARFPGFPGMPGMGVGAWPPMPQQQQQQQQQQRQQAIPSTPAALWRLVHFAVAVALGLYVALATPFAGTRAEREQAAAAHAGGLDAAYSTKPGLTPPDGTEGDLFALHKRYFFYAFATAETVLLTSRFFVEKRRNGGALGGGDGGAAGLLGMAMGFLPPTVKRNVDIALRYWQIFSTVRSDLLVCVFVLGVCSWLRS